MFAFFAPSDRKSRFFQTKCSGILLVLTASQLLTDQKPTESRENAGRRVEEGTFCTTGSVGSFGKTKSRLHQFGTKMLPGKFNADALKSGEGLTGHLIIADQHDIESNFATQIQTQVTSRPETIQSEVCVRMCSKESKAAVGK